ncbi:MAG: hypothetical protein P1V20_22520 [Verrucomicrobiales bacterium]|nr:hypothetical protein [Verrucomicrobiales bacterium]
MLSRSKISIPNAHPDGGRPFVGRSRKVEVENIREDITALIEAIGSCSVSDDQQSLLRSYIYAHYHPELRIKMRVRIYQAVKAALEDDNLNELRDIAGIKKKSAYINTISNVGKRSSYFGGIIGVTVAGYFFLPPIVKLGALPVAKSAIRRFAPKTRHLTPIDKSLKLSSLVGKNPSAVYAGIRKSLGFEVRKAGRPVSAHIDTTPLDDLIGNLFFRSLIEQSSFDEPAKEDFRRRALVAFLYNMARVSRQLEGLARSPDLAWERISNYTNFAMFLKSMESTEVPIQDMLRDAVETISRARIGSGRKDSCFYIEFERGLKYLHYIIEVVEPLDKFNENDVFDDVESETAKLAFFDQNRIVMERLYFEHESEIARVKPMFLDFQKAALEPFPKRAASPEERYEVFQARVKKILSGYRKPLRELGQAEVRSYDAEVDRLRAR